LGNFLIREKLADPTSIFVETFLLIDLMAISTTFFCKSNDAQKRRIRIKDIPTTTHLIILLNNFMDKIMLIRLYDIERQSKVIYLKDIIVLTEKRDRHYY